MKLEIGQTIFVEVFPHRGPTEIRECQIEKIGNKYLTVKPGTLFVIQSTGKTSILMRMSRKQKNLNQ